MNWYGENIEAGIRMKCKAIVAKAGELRKDGLVLTEDCLMGFVDKYPLNFVYKDGNLIYRGVLPPPEISEVLRAHQERISVGCRMGP